MPTNPWEPQDFGSFTHDLQGILRNRLGIESGDDTYKVRFAPNVGGKFIRVEVQKSGEREPLYVDIAPGPQTPQGPSYLLPSISKGSQFSRVVGPEIFVPNTKNPNEVITRTPTEALINYITGAFNVPAFSGMGMQSRFAFITSRGYDAPDVMAVGSLLQVGPMHNKATVAEMARRTNIAFGNEVRDQGAFWQWYNQWTTTGAGPAGSGNYFKNLVGAAPYKGDDSAIRLRYFNAAAPEEIDDYLWQFNIFGKSSSKAIKQANVSYLGGEREQLMPGYYRPNATNTGLVPEIPDLIRTGKEAGLRTLNVEITGNRPEIGVVNRGVAVVPGTPFPGAMIQHKDPIAEQGLIGPFAPTRYTEEIYVPRIQDLASAEFKWGIMSSRTNKAGDVTYKKTADLPGYVLGPGEDAIIGTYRVRGQSGDYLPPVPIRYQSDTRAHVFTGMPSLIIPPAYEEATGYPAQMAGRESANLFGGTVKPVEGKLLSKIKEAAGGAEVLTTGMNNMTISVPLDVQVGRAGKAAGAKFSIQDATQVIGYAPAREVLVGGASRTLQALTAEIKNPTVQFAWGTFGSMSTNQQRMLLGELYGDNSAIQEYANKIRIKQERILRNGGTLEQIQSKWRAMNVYDLAGAAGYSPENAWNFMGDFYAKFLDLAQRDPEGVMKKYGFGISDKPQYLALGALTDDEMMAYKARLETGITRALENKTITAAQAEVVRRTQYKFEPTGKEGLSYWYMQSPFTYGTVTTPTVPEWLWKSLRLGKEELAAVNRNLPDESRLIGLGLSQTPESTGFMPPHVKAWRTMAEMYSYQFARTDKPVLPPSSSYTRLTLNQSEELAERLSSDMGLTEMQGIIDKVVPKGRDILLHPSGQMMVQPRVLQDISKIDRGPGGEEISISSSARRFPDIFKQFVEGGDYSNGPMLSFAGELNQILTMSDTRTISKTVSGRYLESGVGGRFVGATGMGLNTGIISQGEMEGMLLGIAKQSGIKPYQRMGRGKGSPTWLQHMMSEVEEVGGMPGMFFTEPTYGREGGVAAMRFVTPSMLRKRGIDIPDTMSVKRGHVQAGATSLWGVAGAFGPDVERLFRDYDLDPAALVPLMTATQYGSNLKSVMPEFQRQVTMGGLEWLNRQDEVLNRITQGDTKFLGAAGALADVVAASVNPKQFNDWLKNTGLGKATQSEMTEKGVGWLGMKGGMGTSFNARRLAEAAISSLGTFSEASISKLHSAGGLSYASFLEMDPDFEKRSLDAFINSLTPTISGRIGEPGTRVGLQAITNGTQFKKGGLPFDFSNPDLQRDLQRVIMSDVNKKLLTPEFALGMFSSSEEKLAQYQQRLAGGQDVRSILNSIRSEEGFDLSKTPIGVMAATSVAMKMRGFTGKRPYTFPETSPYANLMAESVIGGMEVNFAGQSTRISDLIKQPTIYGAALRYKSDVGTGGILMADELAFMEGQIEAGAKDPQALLIQSQRGTRAAKGAMAVAKAVAGTRSPELYSSNMFVSPSDIPSLAYGGKFSAENRLGIIASQVFGVNMEQIDARKAADMLPFQEAGRRFQAEMGPTVARAAGLTDVAFPEYGLFEENTTFGKMSGTPDIVGVDPKTGKLTIIDTKWSKSHTTAREKLTNPNLVEPQTVGYADLFQTAFKNAQAGGGTGKEDPKKVFTRQVSQSLFPASSWTDQAIQSSVGNWYDAIKNKGIQTGVSSGYGDPGRYRFALNTPVQMFGDYTTARAEELSGMVQATYGQLLTPMYKHAVAQTIQTIGSAQGTLGNISPEAMRLVSDAIMSGGVGLSPTPQMSAHTRQQHANVGTPMPTDVPGGTPPGGGGQPPVIPPVASGPGGGMDPRSFWMYMTSPNTSVPDFSRFLRESMGGQQQRPFFGAGAGVNFSAQEAAFAKWQIGAAWTERYRDDPQGLYNMAALPYEMMTAAAQTIGEKASGGLYGYTKEGSRWRSPSGRFASKKFIQEELIEQRMIEDMGTHWAQFEKLNPEGARLFRESRLNLAKEGTRALTDIQGALKVERQGLLPEGVAKPEVLARMSALAAGESGVDGEESHALAAAKLLTGTAAAGGKSPLKGPLKGMHLEQSEVDTLKLAFDKLTESTTKLNKIVDDETSLKKDSVKAAQDFKLAKAEFDIAQYTPSLKRAQAKRQMYETGALPYSEDEYAQSLQEEASAQEKVGAAENQIARIKEETKPGAWTKGLRKLVGGWGLFYMGTLLGLGSSQWNKNYGVNEQWEQQSSMMEQQAFGVGAITPYVSAENQYRRAQLRAGASMGTMMRNLSAQIAGGPIADIGGAALTGIGMTALAGYIGSASPALAGIGAAAGPIGLIAGAGALAATQISYMTNKESTMISGAANMVNNPLGIFSALWKTSASSVWETLSGQRGLQDTTWMRSQALKEQAERVASGGYSLAELQAMTPQQKSQLSQVYSMSNIEQLANLKPETTNQLFLKLTAGATPEDIAKNMTDITGTIADVGTALEAGIPVDSMAKAIQALRSGAPETESEWIRRARSIARNTPEQNAAIQSGLELMTKIPGAQRKFYGYSEGAIKLEAGRVYSKISGGRWEGQFLERAGIAESRAMLGLDTEVLTGKYERQVEWSPEQLAQETGQNMLLTRGANLAQSFLGMGGNAGVVMNAMRGLEAQGVSGVRFGERLANFSPTAIGTLAMNTFASNPALAGMLGRYAVTDYNLQGEATGLGLWTTSLNQAGGVISATANANQIWGQGRWENNPAAQAITFGINTQTGQIYKTEAERIAAIEGGTKASDIMGGTRAAQWGQYWQGLQSQSAQLGIQYQQIALQEKYMPMFWSIEDRQRNLGYRQQEWSFSQQAASMAMQTRQAQENWGIQATSMQMQRGYQMEDWGYQENVRNLQWGWRQEDFAENNRFLTGRQRKLSERQMERDTTLHNLETGRLDTLKERQKEMWALEDERFALQKRQYMEQKNFQEKALEQQKKFYEEGKQLTEESVKLNRQYQLEQLRLQKESLGVQAQAIENNKMWAATLMKLQDEQDKVQGMYKLAVEEQTGLLQLILEALGGKVPTPGMGGGAYLEAEGGDITPGRLSVVGERGPELLRKGTIGSVINQYDILSAMKYQDKWSSRSVFYPTGASGSGSGSQVVNIYLGNEKLGSYVLNTVKKDLQVL